MAQSATSPPPPCSPECWVTRSAGGVARPTGSGRYSGGCISSLEIDREGVNVTDFQTAQLAKNDHNWTTRGNPEGRHGGPGTYLGPHLRWRDYTADKRVTVALRLENGASRRRWTNWRRRCAGRPGRCFLAVSPAYQPAPYSRVLPRLPICWMHCRPSRSPPGCCCRAGRPTWPVTSGAR